MKIKVGSKWYSDSEVNLCVIFTDDELEAIRNTTKSTMPKNRVISGPSISVDDLKLWADKK